MWMRRKRQGRNAFIAATSLDIDGLSSDNDNSVGISMVTDESTDESEVPADSKFPEEYIFFKANDHVVQARFQRNFVPPRQQEAKER